MRQVSRFVPGSKRFLFAPGGIYGNLLEVEEVPSLDDQGEAHSYAADKDDAAEVRPQLRGRVDVEDLVMRYRIS